MSFIDKIKNIFDNVTGNNYKQLDIHSSGHGSNAKGQINGVKAIQPFVPHVDFFDMSDDNDEGVSKPSLNPPRAIRYPLRAGSPHVKAASRFVTKTTAIERVPIIQNSVRTTAVEALDLPIKSTLTIHVDSCIDILGPYLAPHSLSAGFKFGDLSSSSIGSYSKFLPSTRLLRVSVRYPDETENRNLFTPWSRGVETNTSKSFKNDKNTLELTVDPLSKPKEASQQSPFARRITPFEAALRRMEDEEYEIALSFQNNNSLDKDKTMVQQRRSQLSNNNFENTSASEGHINNYTSEGFNQNNRGYNFFSFEKFSDNELSSPTSGNIYDAKSKSLKSKKTLSVVFRHSLEIPMRYSCKYVILQLWEQIGRVGAVNVATGREADSYGAMSGLSVVGESVEESLKSEGHIVMRDGSTNAVMLLVGEAYVPLRKWIERGSFGAPHWGLSHVNAHCEGGLEMGKRGAAMITHFPLFAVKQNSIMLRADNRNVIHSEAPVVGRISVSLSLPEPTRAEDLRQLGHGTEFFVGVDHDINASLEIVRNLGDKMVKGAKDLYRKEQETAWLNQTLSPPVQLHAMSAFKETNNSIQDLQPQYQGRTSMRYIQGNERGGSHYSNSPAYVGSAIDADTGLPVGYHSEERENTFYKEVNANVNDVNNGHFSVKHQLLNNPHFYEKSNQHLIFENDLRFNANQENRNRTKRTSPHFSPNIQFNTYNSEISRNTHNVETSNGNNNRSLFPNPQLLTPGFQNGSKVKGKNISETVHESNGMTANKSKENFGSNFDGGTRIMKRPNGIGIILD